MQIAGGLDDLRKQAIAIEESLKTTPDFVKKATKKVRRKPKQEVKNLCQ
jgi:hypothetical protein